MIKDVLIWIFQKNKLMASSIYILYKMLYNNLLCI